MVMKKTVKKLYSTIVVARVPYGPFKSKAIASEVMAKVRKVPRVQISKVNKTAKGYTFTAAMLYGLKSASQKANAIAAIKKHAPSAKISFRKA